MEKKEKLVIIGLGETADLATDYFQSDSEYEVCGYAADAKYVDNTTGMLNGLPVVRVEDLQEKYPLSEYKVFVAMGYGHLNHDRTNMYNRIKTMGYKFASYISSRAFIANNVKLGDNCFILENNVIQRNVSIGNNVYLWSGNHIGHRTKIANNVFFSSRVAISGFCSIGDNCFLGINCCVGDGVNIAEGCFIGGGVVLMHDTVKGELYRAPRAEAERLKTCVIFGLEEA